MNLTSSGRQSILSRSNVDSASLQLRQIAPILRVALLLIVVAVYLPPYKQAFVGDDFLQLGYVDEFLHAPARVVRVFHPYWTTWYYRPLQNVWFLANRLLFGLNPFGYYYLQTLWHALTVASLYAIARRLGLARTGALLAMSIFAVNAHHHDVVAWISSIAVIMATTFSLLAIAFYVAYLQEGERRRSLYFAAFLAVLSLFAHEESALLLPFLLLLRLVTFRRVRATSVEVAGGILLLSLTLGLGLVQFLRPNTTISLNDQLFSTTISALNPFAIADYIVTVAGRWLLLNKTPAGATVLYAVRQYATIELFLAGGLLLLLGLWYRRRGQIVRLTLLWIALHLGFLYFVLWMQKPELFAGRHLYSAWAALSLAVGAEATCQLSHRNEQQRTMRSYRVLAFLVISFVAFNILVIGDDQRVWKQHTDEVAAVEKQMKQLLPQVEAQTEIYAHRFVLIPSFTPYAAAVWYEEPGLTGGSLQRMQAQQQATQHTFLFDIDSGTLYNLMPELQEHEETLLLWRPSKATILEAGDSSASASYAVDQVVGPPGAKRLALDVEPPTSGWLSLTYQATVPANSSFVVDALGEVGTTFRVRFSNEEGTSRVLREMTVTEDEAQQWQSWAFSLQESVGQDIMLHLEVKGRPNSAAYWTTPRFVFD